MQTQDFLFEIGTEELPAKQITPLSSALAQNFKQQLDQEKLSYEAITPYATPRRLAILVRNLATEKASQTIEHRGPTCEIAFNQDGTLTAAAQKFAANLGIPINELQTIETPKGKRLIATTLSPKISTLDLLPQIAEQAVSHLPLPKIMRWGNNSIEFTRPVHWLTMIYGTTTVNTSILGLMATNQTYGHRFHHPKAIALPDAAAYEYLLNTQGYVIADFAKRKNAVHTKINAIAAIKGHVIIDEELLEEVTGLVEWPEALLGQFDLRFLNLPDEVLLMAISHQQRCFPILDNRQKLLPYFIVVSNIQSKNPQQVITGNERVIKARLTDAEFFYNTDLKIPLTDHLQRLPTVIFQTKLGSLYDKTTRLIAISKYLAIRLASDATLSARAAQLAKTDLMTAMVGEFPELQGIMGYYYAAKQNEPLPVAIALKEQYLPRFAKDYLPQTDLGAILAIADRLDTLVGLFGINKIPTSEKDPLGVRRVAVGVIRIILNSKLNLDLPYLLELVKQQYANKLENTAVVSQVLDFIFERLRYFYSEQNVNLNSFNAVYACRPVNLTDFDKRLRAIEDFRTSPAAEALSTAHKRINNILKKNHYEVGVNFNPNLAKKSAEKNLYLQLTKKSEIIFNLCTNSSYKEALSILAELKPSVDSFFDEVMVVVDDTEIRANRLALLAQLHKLLSAIADISLLEISSKK